MRVALELPNHLARRDVPHERRLVAAARDEARGPAAGRMVLPRRQLCVPSALPARPRAHRARARRGRGAGAAAPTVAAAVAPGGARRLLRVPRDGGRAARRPRSAEEAAARASLAGAQAAVVALSSPMPTTSVNTTTLNYARLLNHIGQRLEQLQIAR